jgi:hypothetical protein
MSEPAPLLAPLHLQNYLADCPSRLADVIRNSVQHPVSHVYLLNCNCRPSVVTRVLDEAKKSGDAKRVKVASERLAALHKHHQQRLSSSGFYAVPPPGAAPVPNKADPQGRCGLFAIETNEEEGVVRAICRRCRRIFPVFDRALYWGLKRKSEKPPEAWPHRCSCGGHTFEVGIGFDYGDDAMDEMDIHTITAALRCGACDQISLILDEEAT